MSWSGERGGPRILRRGAAVLGGVLLWLVLLAHPASAHAVLVDSEPASGATVAAAPHVVQLWFSEDIAPQFRSARLFDRAGRSVGGTRVVMHRGDARLLSLQLPTVPAGAYGVLWQVLADGDGHTTSGVVVFNVGSGHSAATIAAGGGTAARPLDVVRRWLGLCLLAGLVGGLAVAGVVLGRAAVLDRDPAGPLALMVRAVRRRILAVAAACAGLAALVGLVDLAAETRRLAGGSSATFVSVLGATRWGHLWLVREAALLAAAVVVVRLRATLGTTYRRAGRPLAAAAVLLVLAVVTVEALGTHAAGLRTGRWLAVGADAVHVLTALLWLGALPALALALWPRDGAARPALIRACRGPFTRLALASVGLIVLTGLYSAGREVGTVGQLFGTGYGRTLLVKSGLLLAVGGIGLVNSARLHGRPLPGSLRRLVGAPSRRLVLLEAGVGAVLLVAVGVLLETAPARGPVPSPAPAARPTAQTGAGTTADLVVSVSVSPNRPGVNGFTVLAASSRRPPPAPVDNVVLELARGGDTRPVPLRQVGVGRYFGTGLLDAPGSVRLTAVVQRAGKRLVVPLSWSVGRPYAATRPPATGRRLAPYADGFALALLAGGLTTGVGWLVIRRRRRPIDVVEPAQAPEKVLGGIR